MNEGQPGPPDPGNVLFEAGEHSDHDETACMDLLGVSDPAVDVLFVTFTSSPGDRLDAWKRHADAPPANVGVVSVEVGGTTTGDRFAGEDGPTVLGVSDPSDLTGVGIAVSEVLSEWRDHETPTVVCFESVTALLQYVDSERVFQFLNELTAKFEAADASAHFHITSEAHETQTLGVLSSLFDERVSAADLGYASGSADGSDGAADRAGAAADDGTDARASDTDPFEYADGVDEPEPAIVDTTETPASDGAADGDRDDAAAPPDGDPASAVSSVLDDAASRAPANDDGASRSARTSGARGSDNADVDPDDHSGTPGPADGSDPAADSAGRNFGRRKSTSTDDADDASTDDARHSEDASGRGGGAAGRSAPKTAPESTGARNGDSAGRLPSRSVLYQRTVATVVGVVVMLLLIGVVTSAMPIPLGGDSPAVGPAADATETPTAEPEPTPTTTPTPSPTSEPTETDARTRASTATATPAPT